MPKIQNSWSEREDAYLIANAMHFTYRQISDGLAKNFPDSPYRSRNSVIGRASRLKIRQNPSKMKAHRSLQDARAAQIKRSEPAVVQRVKGWPKPMTETAISFFDMPMFGKCRMPLWGDDEPIASRFYCGSECDPERTYCPGCAALAFVPRAVPANKEKALAA